MLRTLTMLLLTGTLAACASHTTPDASVSPPAAATTNALAGTPMATYGHALNRAKSVQGIVNGQAAKQAAAIESASSSH